MQFFEDIIVSESMNCSCDSDCSETYDCVGCDN